MRRCWGRSETVRRSSTRIWSACGRWGGRRRRGWGWGLWCGGLCLAAAVSSPLAAVPPCAPSALRRARRRPTRCSRQSRRCAPRPVRSSPRPPRATSARATRPSSRRRWRTCGCGGCGGPHRAALGWMGLPRSRAVRRQGRPTSLHARARAAGAGSAHRARRPRHPPAAASPQAAKATCARKVEERKAELTSRKQQLADVLADNDQLRNTIANQALSRADVNRHAGRRGAGHTPGAQAWSFRSPVGPGG
jgi:hypothetical protein